MKFNILINNPTIREACHIVSFHCTDTEFLQMIQEVPRFNHTDLSSKEVALRLIQMRDLEVTVSSYTPKWPWSKAVAYADYKTKTIYFNSRRDFSLPDRVETLWHEASHLLGFSHKGNRVTAYNAQTVPYLGASVFVRYLKGIGVL